ncbi:MAG: SMP-30/gluconolactonase/LRE family protein [Cytophagales bacterium]|nr:SMP-30/gluconolactonase/LRE family protein [Cytophagales bacterium]MDW8383163.1 SMP-30/gluconolactonase/LRE family protein [Flammeovirgaceae bacterium]
MINIADIKILVDGIDHPECVAVDKNNNIWAGGEAGQIYKISSDGTFQEVANTKGFILGVQVSPDNTWLAACDLKNKCVWKLDIRTYQLSVFAKGTADTSFRIPNYPCFDENGNLYVSDSGGFREISGKIFKFDTHGNGVVWYSKPLNFANGLAISPDNQFLMVACTWLPGVMRIPIRPDGKAGEADILVKTPDKTLPDGLAYDKKGNLYISCYAPNTIFRFDTNHRLSVWADDWEAHTLSNPTNMAFSTDNTKMYVANLGRWHIAQIDINSTI